MSSRDPAQELRTAQNDQLLHLCSLAVFLEAMGGRSWTQKKLEKGLGPYFREENSFEARDNGSSN